MKRSSSDEEDDEIASITSDISTVTISSTGEPAAKKRRRHSSANQDQLKRDYATEIKEAQDLVANHLTACGVGEATFEKVLSSKDNGLQFSHPGHAGQVFRRLAEVVGSSVRQVHSTGKVRFTHDGYNYILRADSDSTDHLKTISIIPEERGGRRQQIVIRFFSGDSVKARPQLQGDPSQKDGQQKEIGNFVDNIFKMCGLPEAKAKNIDSPKRLVYVHGSQASHVFNKFAEAFAVRLPPNRKDFQYQGSKFSLFVGPPNEKYVDTITITRLTSQNVGTEFVIEFPQARQRY